MKPRKPIVDYLVYLVVRCLVALLQVLPPMWAFGFAELLATLAYRIDKRHRLIAAENLRFAFPELDADGVDQLVRGCYRHFLFVVVELALLPRKLHSEHWRTYGSLVTIRPAMNAFLKPRPVLTVCAHFGNWEFAGFALGKVGFRSYAIARVLDNPHLERYLKQFRQATGQTIIAKKDDFDRLNAIMQDGGKIATLADQDAGKKGVFVPFFGRLASAHKAVALMAIEYDAILVVVGTPRVREPMVFEITCEEEIDPRDYAARPDAVKAITARYHAALERLIRRHPEQYFWLHRRWKTPPPLSLKSRTL